MTFGLVDVGYTLPIHGLTDTAINHMWLNNNCAIMTLLPLLPAVNFETLPCIPVNSSFSFCFLAPTTCAVTSGTEEVPIEARNFNWSRKLGTDENVSEFQVQIKPMSSIMPVSHNAIMIMVSLVTTYQISYKMCSIHNLTKTAMNHMWLHSYCKH